MVCKSDTFHGKNEPNKTKNEKNENWTNWNGEVPFSAEEYFEPAHKSPAEPPDGLKQLVHVVARATSEQKPLRAIGSGWAFEDIAKSDSWVVSLNQLKRRLHHVIPAALNDRWKQQQLNTAADTQLVHVEAGMKIIDLIDMLEDAGLAMPTLGGANGQNLAGAISTSTHGGDWDQPPLPDVVRAIHLVTDEGRELWIERASEPITTNERLKPVLTCPDTELVRNDSIFDAALVSCGRFGVIYSFVLEVRRAFRVVEVTTRVWDSSSPNLDAVYKALLDGMRSPNNPFARLFNLLSATPPPAGLPEATGVMNEPPYFFQLVWASADPRDMCWVQRRWVTSERDILNPPEPNRADGVQVAHWINFAGSVGLDFIRKDKGVAVMDDAFDKSVREGLRGPHHLLTSGTREASESTTYTGNSIEVMFDARGDRWWQFLNTVFDAAGGALGPPHGEGMRQAGWISLRPSRASRALLSMHNVASSHAVSIEITILKGLPDNVAFMDIVHSAALKFGGRPHWGQMNRLNEQQAVDLYGQQLQNWRTALTLVSGSSKTFSNSFTRRRGLEPTSIQRKITALSPSRDELIVVALRNGNDKYNYVVNCSRWTPTLIARPQMGPQQPVRPGQGRTVRPGTEDRGWDGWHPLKPASGLPDNFIGSAAEGGKAYVFWIAPDGWVNYTVRGQDGQWARSWGNVGNSNTRERNGVPGGAVHAVSCQPGMLHVFYTDRQGGILAVLGDTSGGPPWPERESKWIDGCKTIAGGHVTAVSRRPGQVDAFVVGTDGQIYTAAWNSQERRWSKWGVIKGLTAKAGAYIGAVSRSVNLLDIFLADEEGRTMSAAWAGQAGWTDWWHIQGGITNPGGYVTVISRSNNKLDIFTTGIDQRVQTAAWDPSTGWAGWWPIKNAKAQSLVWPVSRSQDKIDLFFVAPDGSVQTTAWAPDHSWDGPRTIS